MEGVPYIMEGRTANMLVVIAGLCIYGIFLVGPIWIAGILICRQNAWWNEQDKVSNYFEIRSPKAADFLIGKYSGYNTHVRTNIPLLYNRYRINRYPSRLSALGAANYVVTAFFAIWYAVGITSYFLFGWTGNPLVPSGIALLMIQAFVFIILCNWNKSCVQWSSKSSISLMADYVDHDWAQSRTVEELDVIAGNHVWAKNSMIHGRMRRAISSTFRSRTQKKGGI